MPATKGVVRISSGVPSSASAPIVFRKVEGGIPALGGEACQDLYLAVVKAPFLVSLSMSS